MKKIGLLSSLLTFALASTLSSTIAAEQKTRVENPKRVLIVLTSHGELGNTGKQTGYYLPELSHPLFELIDAKVKFDIASPKGGKAPMDPKSRDLTDEANKKFVEDKKLSGMVDKTIPLKNVKAKGYSAIFFPGGHGPMWDLVSDKDVDRLTREIYEAGGAVAAVCHGPAALANVKLSDGSYLIKGKKLAAFTNEEEKAVKLDTVVPFLLESKLEERGATIEKSPLWEPKVVVDGRLVTGQNPKSAAGVGKSLVEVLSK